VWSRGVIRETREKGTTPAQAKRMAAGAKKGIDKEFEKTKKGAEHAAQRRAETFKNAVIQKLQAASTSTGTSTSLGDGIPALIEALEVKPQRVRGMTGFVIGLKNPKAIDKETGKSLETIAKSIEYGTSGQKPLSPWRWVARRIGTIKDTGR